MAGLSPQLLQQLSAPSFQDRSEALDSLAAALQDSDWRIPEAVGRELIHALRERLSDSNWCFRPPYPQRSHCRPRDSRLQTYLLLAGGPHAGR